MSILNKRTTNLMRLSNKLNQIISLGDGNFLNQVTVERVYLSAGRMIGSYYDHKREVTRKVRSIQNSTTWVLR